MEWRYISDKIHDALQYFDEGEAYGYEEEQNCQGINVNSNLALYIRYKRSRLLYDNITKYLVSIISRFRG